MSASRLPAAPALLLLAAVGLYVGLAVTSLRTQSATFDEGAHLPAGYTYLALGDHRLNPEQPPLVKLLAAAPLLALKPVLKTDDEAWATARQWEFGKRFLYRWNDGARLLLWGRMPSSPWARCFRWRCSSGRACALAWRRPLSRSFCACCLPTCSPTDSS